MGNIWYSIQWAKINLQKTVKKKRFPDNKINDLYMEKKTKVKMLKKDY